MDAVVADNSPICIAHIQIFACEWVACQSRFHRSDLLKFFKAEWCRRGKVLTKTGGCERLAGFTLHVVHLITTTFFLASLIAHYTVCYKCYISTAGTQHGFLCVCMCVCHFSKKDLVQAVRCGMRPNVEMISSLFWQYLVWYDNCRAATDAHNRQSCLSGEEVQDLCHLCHLKTK